MFGQPDLQLVPHMCHTGWERPIKAEHVKINADRASCPGRYWRRPVRRGHLTLHLPEGWHREREWLNLWEAGCGLPAATA
jgi:hypothetical protein